MIILPVKLFFFLKASSLALDERAIAPGDCCLSRIV